ncbi:hypothetical protein GCM10025877_30080 [Agromyces mangrovi Wang et al. 2018]|nr:hypothetical protein [Agromyces mangrovi]BDZ66070.1 hypothetical protein GCM10025877_30080 [Agromyces mangrovi]
MTQGVLGRSSDGECGRHVGAHRRTGEALHRDAVGVEHDDGGGLRHAEPRGEVEVRRDVELDVREVGVGRGDLAERACGAGAARAELGGELQQRGARGQRVEVELGGIRSLALRGRGPALAALHQDPEHRRAGQQGRGDAECEQEIHAPECTPAHLSGARV